MASLPIPLSLPVSVSLSPCVSVLQVIQRPDSSDGAPPVRLQRHSHPQRQQEEETRAEDRPPGGRRSGACCAQQRAGRRVAQGKGTPRETLYNYPEEGHLYFKLETMSLLSCRVGKKHVRLRHPDISKLTLKI